MNVAQSLSWSGLATHGGRTGRGWLSLLSFWAAILLMSGCSVFWISAYDKESADRSTEISRQVLKIYQDLLAVNTDQRSAALSGTIKTREGDVESLMRLHLLKEQARQKNEDSIKVAENMLESWQSFSVNHRKTDATALSDATLGVERGVMERHFRSAFVAEEAKKLGGGK
mgnify:CR=1 FL=1